MKQYFLPEQQENIIEMAHKLANHKGVQLFPQNRRGHVTATEDHMFRFIHEKINEPGETVWTYQAVEQWVDYLAKMEKENQC